MTDWRDDVDPLIKEHLEAIISESYRHRTAYKNAKNTANAQLWCAVALLQKQLFDISLKIKFLEKVIAEMNGKKQKDDVDAAKALKEVLKKL